MPPRKRNCSCGCGQRVDKSTESRHLNLKGPKFLAAQALANNPWALKRSTHTRSPDNHRQPPPPKRRKKRATRTRTPPESDADDSPIEDPPEPETALSAPHRSIRVEQVVKQAQDRRWVPGRPRATVEDESESDAEPQPQDADINTEASLDDDDDAEDDGDSDVQSLLHASPGQEGISLWDLMGEGFLKVAAALG